MQTLIETYQRLLAEIRPSYRRRFYDEFSLDSRLTGIVGARGVGKTTFLINEKELEVYFPVKEMQVISKQPLTSVPDKFKITAHILGGGIHSQSEALRHGIARALTEYNSELRKTLKKAGYLKRDPRAKERRKFGLKKARKAPQWSKR